jgi:hypothetical protein
MMAPVSFFAGASVSFEPYYVSPWQCEEKTPADPVLQTLRGDFFCLPFGAGGSYGGEYHDSHGETAIREWDLEDAGRFEAVGSGEADAGRGKKRVESRTVRHIDFSLSTSARPGTVHKSVSLVDGHAAVYVRHVLEGFRGAMPLGHHATLKGAPEENPALVSTSSLRYGITAPRETSYHARGEYYALRPLAEFASLRAVPTVWSENPTADLSVFPARPGFVDIAQVFQQPGEVPAWTTVTFPSEGFLWYSLKDARVLPSTVLWMENRGRHQQPWNGRNCCLGLEDVCSFVAEGLGPSVVDNPVRSRGLPTAVELSPAQPFVVNYVQGVVAVPEGFRRVVSVEFGPQEITFHDESGFRATAAVAHEFVDRGTLSG